MKRISVFLFVLITMNLMGSCAGANPELQLPADPSDGRFVKTGDGTRIFVYDLEPKTDPKTSIYIITGYTGIDHRTEKDVIELLSDNKYRVVVIHPRGTGYSEGSRGDVDDYSIFLNDFAEIINADIHSNKNGKVVLYGHSISTAMALGISPKLKRIDGTILVNPPYKMKASPGMTPGIGDYMKFIFYMVFAPHTPVVNMAGEPSKIQNPEERKEAETRSKNPLLVKYISMYMMMKSKELLDRMVQFAAEANNPLLLLYGSKDSIIEKQGCDEIFNAWKDPKKEFRTIRNGPHGKLTVLRSKAIIRSWLKKI